MEQRTTRQKQLIMDILLHAQQPLTAQEVHARAVRQLPNLAKSTVYRNLEAMKARGEITQGMLDNGESYYEAVHDGEHKHYLVCKDCHIRVDLPDCPARTYAAGNCGRRRFHHHRPRHPAVRLLSRMRCTAPDAAGG